MLPRNIFGKCYAVTFPARLLHTKGFYHETLDFEPAAGDDSENGPLG